MGDPELAGMMRQLKVPAPVEQIIRTEIIPTVMNRLNLAGRRVVLLACGHRAVTANSRRVACGECHRMILDGEDYEAFRNRKGA